MQVKFLKDYWSFRKGQIVSVDELTLGRAHVVVAQGFAEYCDSKAEPAPEPQPPAETEEENTERVPKKKQKRLAIREPKETRDDVRSSDRDETAE